MLSTQQHEAKFIVDGGGQGKDETRRGGGGGGVGDLLGDGGRDLGLGCVLGCGEPSDPSSYTRGRLDRVVFSCTTVSAATAASHLPLFKCTNLLR